MEGFGDSKKSFTGAETYLTERSYFADGRNGEWCSNIQIFRMLGFDVAPSFTGDIRVPPGRYGYNFHCNLPAGVPTSLEGHIGYIRYQARVVLDISWAPNEEFEDAFTVIKPLNLNYDPALRVSSTNLRHLFHYNGAD